MLRNLCLYLDAHYTNSTGRIGRALRRYARGVWWTALRRVRRGIEPHDSDRSSDTEVQAGEWVMVNESSWEDEAGWSRGYELR